MAYSTGTTATVTFPEVTDFLVTRDFRAAPEVLYEAFTTPEIIRQWWGPRSFQMREVVVDLRVGGSYRFVHASADGQEHAFSGEYLELDPPSRMVWTERYEAFPDSEHVLTVELVPQDGGVTQLRMRAVFPDQFQRDQWVGAGMEKGMQETYQRLDEYLAARG